MKPASHRIACPIRWRRQPEKRCRMRIRGSRGAGPSCCGSSPRRSMAARRARRPTCASTSSCAPLHSTAWPPAIEVSALFTGDEHGPRMQMLIYLPGGRSAPAPLFIGLNFYGNHAIHPDPEITLAAHQALYPVGTPGGDRQPAARGVDAEYWPIERILSRAAMGWPRFIAPTWTPTSTTGFRMASTRCSMRRGSSARPPTSGARSGRGPGASAGRWIISRPTRRSTTGGWR